MANINETIKEIKSINNLVTVLNYYGVQVNKDNKAVCPFHNEKTPSFSIKESNNEAMWHCFGSCGESGDIVSFIQKQDGTSVLEATKKAYEILGRPLQLEGSNDKLGNFISFISNNKWEGWNYEHSFIYVDTNSNPVYLKHKYRNATDKTKKTFVTKSVVETEKGYKHGPKEHFEKLDKVVYNLPKVKEAINKGNNVYFVEGEKDADRLKMLGFTATTIYSKKWEEAYTEQLKGAKIVFIGDTGKAGKEFRQLIWNSLKDVIPCFRVVSLPGLEALGDNKDVTDWLESGKTKDDLLEAIKDSWDWKVSTKWKDVTIKKDKKTGENIITPLVTIDNFKLILERTETEVFYNLITREVESKSKTFDALNANTLETELYSYCNKINFKHKIHEIRTYLRAIALKNSINPFKVYLDSLQGKWDGQSRFKEFCDLFETVEFYDTSLKEMILKKWLMQFLGSAYDPKYKGQGVLVLKGRQGMGKTTAMEHLIPINEPWVILTEQKFIDTRDGIQTITSNQLVELSEFARSNKEIDAIKGFITTPFDKYVMKFMPNAEAFKRYTVYYATINDDEFLLDDSNRRFWVLDLKSIDIEGFEAFDFNQLWAEMYHLYHIENDKEYWLQQEETEQLEESNQSFKFKGELEGQIGITFDFNSSKRVWLTATEIIEFLGKSYTPTKVTRTLKSMRIEQKEINNKQVPRNKYNAMPYPKYWKGKVPQSFRDRIVHLKAIDPPQDSRSNDDLVKKLEAYKKLTLIQKEELIKKDNMIKELQEYISFLENNEAFKTN